MPDQRSFDPRYEYDWRARIGVLSPSSDRTPWTEEWGGPLRTEWNSVLPDGVKIYQALMELTETTPESLVEMRKIALAQAVKLESMDIILFGCTSGSFIGGLGYDQEIIKEIESALGTPATTTSTCVLEAFSDLGVKRIALIGPYIKEVFDAEVQFFRQHGIETAYLKGLGFQYVKDIRSVGDKPHFYYRMAKEAYRSVKDIDAIFITCMASPAIKIIDVLEQETGVYVLSSISASLYGVLKRLGIKGPIQNYGRLFGKL